MANISLFKEGLLKEVTKNVSLSIYNVETNKRIVTILYPCSCISKQFIEGEVKEQITLSNAELGVIAHIPIEDIVMYGYINPSEIEEELVLYTKQ